MPLRDGKAQRPRGMARLVRAVTARLGSERVDTRSEARAQPCPLAYQAKTAASLTLRLDRIKSAFPADVRSVLDVGCNIGNVTAGLAHSGYWTVGLDSSPSLVREAQRLHGDTRECAFMVQELGPGDIGKLPEFDAVLLLSVHHHWLREWGPEVAGEMLREITVRSRRVLIFEGASRRARYGAFAPDFDDNDESTVTAYLEDYLHSHAGSVTSAISPLGAIPCVGAREPVRWNYALYR